MTQNGSTSDADVVSWDSGLALEAFVQRMIKIGSEGLLKNGLNDSDTYYVETGTDILTSNSHYLHQTLSIISFENPELMPWLDDLRDEILGMMNGVLMIAQSAEISESARAAFQTKQADAARQAKSARDAARCSRLSEAIMAEAEAQNRAIAVSTTFADQVRPGVRRRLEINEEDTWPSNETIKKTARSIRSG